MTARAVLASVLTVFGALLPVAGPAQATVPGPNGKLAFTSDRNGTRDIFLNTPNQAAWFERFVTDWTGPTGRLGRLRFKMRKPIFPGDTMVIEGVVRDVSVDVVGCGWVELDLTIRVGDVICTESEAKVAVPTSPDDNPWRRHGDRWTP